MKMEQELNKLNAYQKAAVLNDSRSCLLNACVGSGKTTVLVTKVQYLVKVKQIPLEQIFVLTFTNKAANEIMDRLETKEEPLIGTFHSVALWLLRNQLPIEKYGFTKDFCVIEPDEELDIAMMLINDHKLTIKYKNRLKKRLEKAMLVQDESQKVSRYQDDLFTLVSMLKEEKQHQNKMSFFDLLTYCELLQKERTEYPSYIVVDEVQDCDLHQIQFLQAFMGEQTHLFAVGDPNQVIYSWRGGDLNIFYRMKHLFQAEELHLPINYRSSSSILEAAKCFLQNGDALEGSREQGAKIVIQKQYDTFQDANYITERIKKLHREGMPYSEIAVFYRLQSQSEMFSKVFEREEIPYSISQKKTIRDIPVLNWLIKILHACVNPKDKTSMILAISNKEFGCGITETKLKKMITEEKNLPDLYEKMTHFKDTLLVEHATTKDGFIQYFQLQKHLHPTSADYENNLRYVETFLEAFFHEVQKEIQIKVPMKMKAEVKKEAKKEAKINGEGDHPQTNLILDSMLTVMNEMTLQGTQILNGFLNEKENSFGETDTQDKVNLMTLHASKGLEFSQVFITGVNYGWIPLQTKDEESEEEERRLFFVGITRAKDRLEMSYYTNPGAMRVMPGPSRYLEMIPKRLIESNDMTVSQNQEQPETTDIFKLQNLRKQVQIEQMKKKMAHSTMGAVLGNLDNTERKVRHEKYGVGTVIREDDMMITVRFEGYGEKAFVKMMTQLTDV